MNKYEYCKDVSCHTMLKHKGQVTHISLHKGHIYELPFCDKVKSLLLKGMIKKVNKSKNHKHV